MDKLTHISITNCIKELDALGKLALSEQFSYKELADWIEEISWNLSEIFRRRRYNSDEFQHRLKKMIVEDKKKTGRQEPGDEDESDDT